MNYPFYRRDQIGKTDTGNSVTVVEDCRQYEQIEITNPETQIVETKYKDQGSFAVNVAFFESYPVSPEKIESRLAVLFDFVRNGREPLPEDAVMWSEDVIS